MPEKKRYSEKDKQAPNRDGDRPKKYAKKSDDTRSFGKDANSYRGKQARTGETDNKGFRKQRSESDPNAEKPFRKSTGRFEDKPRNVRSSKPFTGREDRSDRDETFDRKGKGRDFSSSRSFDKRDDGGGEERSFSRKRQGEDFKPARGFKGKSDSAGKRPFESRGKSDDTRKPGGSRSFDRRDDETREERPYGRKKQSEDFKPARGYKGESDNTGKRPYESRKRSDDTRKPGPSRSFDRRDDEAGEERPFNRKRQSEDFKPGKQFKEERTGKRSYNSREESGGQRSRKPSRSFEDNRDEERDEQRPYRGDRTEHSKSDREFNERKERQRKGDAVEEMPLNKYIAHSGECSRRDAAELVKQGKVKVNDVLILDPGHKVTRNDKITLSGKKLTPQKGLVYILLNKPKGYITTTDDEKGRRTVIDIVQDAAEGSRLFPVGRLDRNTTGLLLITNDGALAQKLSHPSFNAKKIYQVTLDKQLTKADFEKVLSGVELEDGVAHADALAYLEDKKELGIEIHSGKNRIVRRIFESMGYVVEKLDRMMYAGLTKKNLPRGKWRYLNEREIVLLKHFKS